MRANRIVIVMLLLAGVALAATGCGPGRYYNKGVEKYNVGNYDGALGEFNKALAKDKNKDLPDTGDWIVKCYMKRGEKSYDTNIYVSIADFARAVDEGRRLGVSQALSEEAQDLHDKAVAEQDRRAAESRELQHRAEGALAGRDYDEAEQLAAEAMRIDPRNREAVELMNKVREIKMKIGESKRLVDAGNALLRASDVNLRDAETAKRKFEHAVELYEFNADAEAGITLAGEIIARIKRDAETQYQRGLVHFEAREWSASMEALEECLRLDYTRGDASEKLQEAREMYSARRSYEAYLDRARSKLIGAAVTADGAAEAMRLCERAIDVYPFNDEAKKLRGEAFERREELLARAEKYYRDGVVAMEAGDWKAAKTEFNKCLAISASHTKAKASLAEVRIKIEYAEKAAKLLEKGEEYLERKRPYDAKKAFQDALKIDPGNLQAADGIKRADEMIAGIREEARILYDSAMEKLEKNDFDGALGDLDKAIEKDPHTPLYERKRGEVRKRQAKYYYDSGKQYEKEEKWVKAQKEYEKAAEYDVKYQADVKRMKDESEAEGMIQVGNIHMSKGRYLEAARMYKDALALTSRRSMVKEKIKEALDKLKAEADAEWQAGNYEEALAQLEDIQKIDFHYDNLKQLIPEYRRRLDEAERNYNEAVKKRESLELSAAKEMLEKLLADLPKYKDADAILKGINDDLDQAKRHYDRGMKYEKDKKYELAIARYDDVLALVKDYKDAAGRATDLKAAAEKYADGEKLLSEKKLEEALEAFKAVREIRDDYADVKDKTGKIENDIDEVAWLYKKGKECQKKEEWQKAVGMYEAALDLIYDYKDVKERLAECRGRLEG